MKTIVKQFTLAIIAINTFAHCIDNAVGPQQVMIYNATTMPLVIRAMRRAADSARWRNIPENDKVFDRKDITLSERKSMTQAFMLNPGETVQLLWLQSWKFDLLFAPVGSDLAERLSSTPCSVTKTQVISDLHEGNWSNISSGTRLILYFIPSETAKRQLLRSDVKNLIGKKVNQENISSRKINMAVIKEVEDKLTPEQAKAKQQNFLNTLHIETEQ